MRGVLTSVLFALLGCGRLAVLEGAAEVRGQVVEREGGGVQGARVLLIDGQTASIETRTDASGHFTLGGVTPGAHSLLVLAGGARGTWRKSLDFRAGGVTTLDTLELEDVWAYPDVLWLRDVGFDEQWTHGPDGLLVFAEGVEAGTLLAFRFTSGAFELVVVDRAGRYELLFSVPRVEGRFAPWATVVDEHLLLTIDGSDSMVFDLRARRALHAVPTGARLLTRGDVLFTRAGHTFLSHADGATRVLPELDDATPLLDVGDDEALFRTAGGRLARVRDDAVTLGDEVAESLQWAAGAPGALAIGAAADGWVLYTVDEGLQVREAGRGGVTSSSGTVPECWGGKPRALQVRQVDAGGAERRRVIAWSAGALTTTILEDDAPPCLMGDLLLQSATGFVASTPLGGLAARTTLPPGTWLSRYRRDGRVFIEAVQQRPRLRVLTPGQPVESAVGVGRIPFVTAPQFALRDGTYLVSGLDPEGGSALYRVESP